MDERTPPNPDPSPAATTGGTVKETIESILIAFILAFVFRAFIVEAFVIPTGSMAPTLLGAHMRFRCPDCGYAFDVNYSQPHAAGRRGHQHPPHRPAPSMSRTRAGQFEPRKKTFAIYCPNCGYKVPDRNVDDPGQDATDPQALHYGDRILVLKYLYLFQPPQRWDVVVFKSPDNPGTFDYSQNYIKRLIGKPGETLMVLDVATSTWATATSRR